MAMQVILTQDVPNLGKAGELVSVRPGFGRNFLLPKGMAVTATNRNVTRLEHERQVIARTVAKERAAAGDIATRINGMTLQFERLVSDDDKMYGSVTTGNIAEQLEKAGVKLDHRKVQLAEPVKSLGKYEVQVRLHQDVSATLKFWVVAKDKDKK
jgi:large subunit ribosomal protein L9